MSRIQIGLISGTLVLALLAPLIVTDRFWLNLLIVGGIYLVLTLGLTLLFGYADQISLGHAGFFGVGAYTSALLVLELETSAWIGIAAAPVATGFIGYLLSRPILRLRGLSLAMGTLAFGEIAFVLFRESELTGGPIGLPGITPPQIGSYFIQSQQSYYWLVLGVVVVCFWLSRNVGRSHMGRALRALGTNQVAAAVMGIDTSSYKARIFAYSAALAGVSGALYAHYITFISSASFSLSFSILVVVMVVVGGLRSLWGAMLGSLGITALQAFLGQREEYSGLIFGILLILVFMYLPEGVVGGINKVQRLVAPFKRLR